MGKDVFPSELFVEAAGAFSLHRRDQMVMVVAQVLLEQLGTVVLVVEVHRRITGDPTIEMVVMGNHRAASAQCLYQRRVGASYLMTMDVKAAEKPKGPDHRRLIDGAGEDHFLAGRVHHPLVVFVLLWREVAQHHQLMVTALAAEGLDHLQKGVLRLRPGDNH